MRRRLGLATIDVLRRAYATYAPSARTSYYRRAADAHTPRMRRRLRLATDAHTPRMRRRLGLATIDVLPTRIRHVCAVG